MSKRENTSGKKIVVVSNMYPSDKHPSFGIFVKNIVEGLVVQGAGIELLVMQSKSQSKLLKVFDYLSFVLRSFWGLVRVSREDIVYVHYVAHSGIPVLLTSLFKRLNVIANVHGGDVLQASNVSDFQFKINHFLSSKLLKLARKTVVPSEYCKNIVTTYGVKVDDIIVSPSGGIDRSVFSVRLKPEDSFKTNGVLTLGYAGRLAKGKGLECLIMACNEAKLANIPFELNIAGAGDECENLMSLIQQQELSTHCTLFGELPHNQLAQFYAALDFLVFPTELNETLGLVGLESMAVGTPVIGSRIGGIIEYLDDNKNGFSFMPGNLADLVSKIIKANSFSCTQYAAMSAKALITANQYDSVETRQNLFKIFQ